MDVTINHPEGNGPKSTLDIQLTSIDPRNEKANKLPIEIKKEYGNEQAR